MEAMLGISLDRYFYFKLLKMLSFFLSLMLSLNEIGVGGRTDCARKEGG
jgi:hypothetical protein